MVGRTLATVEDVVGRNVDERDSLPRAAPCMNAGACGIHAKARSDSLSARSTAV